LIFSPPAKEANKGSLKNNNGSRKGDQQGKKCCPSVCTSVTLNSSLSFEAREVKFCIQTADYLANKSYQPGFLIFVKEQRDMGVFPLGKLCRNLTENLYKNLVA